MSIAQNHDLVRRYFAALDAGRLDLVADLFAPDYRLRFDSNPELEREAALGFFGGFLAALSDVRHEVRDLIAEGDRVAARIEVGGIHTGDLMGIPPTGQRLVVPAVNVMRIAHGRFVEHWVSSDTLGLLRQLGVIPVPEPVAA